MTTRERRDCRCPRVKHQHGTWHAYTNDGCGCLPCRRAWAAYSRHLRHRRHRAGGTVYVDPTGTARRLQALAANGWGLSDIAPLIGVSSVAALGLWRAGGHAKLRPTTAARVRTVYDRIWDKPSPNRYAVKIRNIAQANGWLPPLAWDDDSIDDPKSPIYKPETPEDYVHIRRSSFPAESSAIVDEIAVERAMRGERVPLTKAEKTEAFARLNRMGYSAPEIAGRLGVSDRTVVRKRSAA